MRYVSVGVFSQQYEVTSVYVTALSVCNFNRRAESFLRGLQFRGYSKKLAIFKFKVCKSVHHRKIQINHQSDATIFQFIILTFIYSVTCFGRFPAHHQELNYCGGSLWFYLRIVVIVVLCSWSGRL
jgi:hypothetical protein